jgi:hypothetical protein
MKAWFSRGFHLVRRQKILFAPMTAMAFVVQGTCPNSRRERLSPSVQGLSIVLTVFYNSDVQNPARLFKNLGTRDGRGLATSRLIGVTLVGVALAKIKGMAIFLP